MEDVRVAFFVSFLFVCTRPFCLPIAGVISRSEECGGHGYPPAGSSWKGALFLFLSTFFFLDPTLTAFSVQFLICVNRCWISHMKTKTNKSDRCLRLSCASVRLLFFANDDVHKNVALIRDVKGSRPENRAVSLSYRGELLR